jgi:hypothetical protein
MDAVHLMRRQASHATQCDAHTTPFRKGTDTSDLVFFRQIVVRHAPCLGAAYLRTSTHARAHTPIHKGKTVFETILRGDIKHYTQLVKVEMLSKLILRNFIYLIVISIDYC